MSNPNKLTKAEIEVIRAIRNRGFAVILWNPDELKEADSDRVEERSIEFGWDLIETLNDIA